MDLRPAHAQEAARERARAFVSAEILPFARAWDEEGRWPEEMVARLAAAGLLAGPLPPEHGGEGWDAVSRSLVLEEFGAGCSSVRGFLTVQWGLVALAILKHGSPAHRDAWLRRLGDGSAVGCAAMTEEGAGSDLSAAATTARREADGWVLDGEKIWITNGTIAQVALVLARTGGSDPRRALSAFLVPAAAPGFEAERMPGSWLGHRAADHARIRFRGCRVPADALVGREGQGLEIMKAGLDAGRLGVAAGAVGVHRACLEEAVSFARARRQFGQRVGDFQMVQERLADMKAECEASRLLVWRAALLQDAGDPEGSPAASLAKAYAVEAAHRAASEAVLLLGSRGYANDSPVERHARDIQGMRIYEGSSYVQKMLVARHLLGPDPEKRRG